MENSTEDFSEKRSLIPEQIPANAIANLSWRQIKELAGKGRLQIRKKKVAN